MAQKWGAGFSNLYINMQLFNAMFLSGRNIFSYILPSHPSTPLAYLQSSDRSELQTDHTGRKLRQFHLLGKEMSLSSLWRVISTCILRLRASPSPLSLSIRRHKVEEKDNWRINSRKIETLRIPRKKKNWVLTKISFFFLFF